MTARSHNRGQDILPGFDVAAIPRFEEQFAPGPDPLEHHVRPASVSERELGAQAVAGTYTEPLFTDEAMLSPEALTPLEKLRAELKVLTDFDQEDRCYNFIEVAKPGGVAREAIIRRNYRGVNRFEAKRKLDAQVRDERAKLKLIRFNGLAHHAEMAGVPFVRSERDGSVKVLSDDDLVGERLIREHQLYRLQYASARNKDARKAHKEHLRAQVTDLKNPQLMQL